MKWITATALLALSTSVLSSSALADKTVPAGRSPVASMQEQMQNLQQQQAEMISLLKDIRQELKLIRKQQSDTSNSGWLCTLEPAFSNTTYTAYEATEQKATFDAIKQCITGGTKPMYCTESRTRCQQR